MLSFSLKARLGERTFRYSASLDQFPTGLFGPSGAGKSTLLHMLAGLRRPDSGWIKLGDDSVLDTEQNVSLQANRRHIGLVHQDGLLFPHLNIRENLLYGRKRMPHHATIDFDEVVDVLELAENLDQAAGSVSGGERQRIALARAILAEPRLLLCDEPLASVDARLKWKILPYLSQAIEHFRIPTIYVSHDQREITAISNQLMVMEEGSIIAHGPYQTIIDQLNVYEVFTRERVENALRCRLLETDWQAGLSKVKSGDAEFLIPPRHAEPGEELTVAIKANDIILALEKPTGISTRNALPGTVTRLTTLGKLVLVHVDVGCDLLVELTPSAIAELGLREGTELHCLIKTNSFLILG